MTPKPKNNPSNHAPFAEAFAFGLLAIVAQVVLLREFLVAVSGNELFLGLFFAVWFFGIFIGAAGGGRLAERARRPDYWIAGGLAVQALLLPVSIATLRALRLILDVPPGELLPLGALCLALLAHLLPFSLLTGLLFPFFCRRLELQRERRGGAVGWVYTVESLGAMFGGALVTVLLAWRSTAFGLAALGAMAVGLALILGGALERPRPRPRLALGALALLVATALAATPRGGLEQLTAQWRWRGVGQGLRRVAEIDSPYQHLALAEQSGQYMLFSNGAFVFAFPDEYTAESTAHFLATQAPAPRHILLAGGNPGLLKHLLKHRPQAIDLVEIDPALLEMIAPHLPEADRAALADPRVQVRHDDARRLIRAAPPGAYDLIVCLTPDPSTSALNRYYTREFFDECRRAMAERGVLAFSLTTATNYVGEEVGDFTGSVHGALDAAFANLLVTPGPESFLLASNASDAPTSDAAALAARFTARDIATSAFAPEHFASAFEPHQTRFINQALRRAARETAPNTDRRPVSAFYNLALWERYSGSATHGGLRMLKALKPRTVWMICLLPALLGLTPVLLARGTRRAAPRLTAWFAVWAMALSGVAGIAFSLIVLLSFQTHSGELYGEIGLLTALYFLGLAVGGYAFRGAEDEARVNPLQGGPFRREGPEAAQNNKGLKETQGPSRQAGPPGALRAFAWWELGFAALLGVVALTVAIGWPAKIAIYAAMLAGGVASGAEFPLLARVLAPARGRRTGVVAGAIDAADHLGAALGALATVLLLAPLVGLAASLLVLLALKMLCALAAFRLTRATQ